ncbi:MAG: hypothetical protein WA324_27635 [Bryobacteraceae bacterium]
MKPSRTHYWRLGPSAWLEADHLLVVSTRFFGESYMRLYRGDIEAIVLYSLHRNRDAVFLLEWVCALVPSLFCFYLWWTHASYLSEWRGARVLIPGFVFLVAYAVWRLAQPNWACLVSTRTSRAGLVLGRTAAQAQRKFAELVAWIAEPQQSLNVPLSVEPRRVDIQDPNAPKPYTQAVHGGAFACGMLGWILLATRSPYLLGLASLALMAYYILLAAAYTVQNTFGFPFPVKSAAVMSQIAALVCLVTFLSATPWVSGSFYLFLQGQHLAMFAGISAVTFGLYGLIAMILATSEITSPGAASRSVLGLEG